MLAALIRCTQETSASPILASPPSVRRSLPTFAMPIRQHTRSFKRYARCHCHCHSLNSPHCNVQGVNELLDEGAVQMLRDQHDDGSGTPLLAAVGQLQFEVVEYRLQAEYGVTAKLEHLTFNQARWVGGGWDAVRQADKADKLFGVNICQDRWQRPVLLFRNPWKVAQLVEEVPYLLLQPWAMPPTEFL